VSRSGVRAAAACVMHGRPQARRGHKNVIVQTYISDSTK
jgi:hypothetical protein